MKLFLVLLILVILSCNVMEPELRGEITWDDVLETSWSYTEELNIYETVYMLWHFHKDTLFLTKTYYNPKTLVVNWIRYIKAPIYNRHYEIPPGPPPDDVNLVFTWKRKEYVDASYQTPIMDNSVLIDWFLWKIDKNGNLLMGEVDSNRHCWYWEFNRVK